MRDDKLKSFLTKLATTFYLIGILSMILIAIEPTLAATGETVHVRTAGNCSVMIYTDTINNTYDCNTADGAFQTTCPDTECPECTNMSCERALQNLSNMMAKILEGDKDRKAYFDLYANCNANLTLCRDKEKSCEENTDFEKKYNDCETQRKTCVNTDLPNCVTEKNRCVNTDLPNCVGDRDKANSDKMLFLIGGAVAAALLTYFVGVKKGKVKSILNFGRGE